MHIVFEWTITHNICFDYIHDSNLSSYIRFFRITPSLFSQRGLHLSHQASLPSGTRGCSWLRYSLRQSFGIVSGACAHKGLPMIIYAIELRVFVGWRIESISYEKLITRFSLLFFG